MFILINQASSSASPVLCLAQHTVLHAFISGFTAHRMALENARTRKEMREYCDEPPDDSEW